MSSNLNQYLIQKLTEKIEKPNSYYNEIQKQKSIVRINPYACNVDTYIAYAKIICEERLPYQHYEIYPKTVCTIAKMIQIDEIAKTSVGTRTPCSI